MIINSNCEIKYHFCTIQPPSGNGILKTATCLSWQFYYNIWLYCILISGQSRASPGGSGSGSWIFLGPPDALEVLCKARPRPPGPRKFMARPARSGQNRIRSRAGRVGQNRSRAWPTRPGATLHWIKQYISRAQLYFGPRPEIFTEPPKNDVEHDCPVERVMGHKIKDGKHYYYVHLYLMSLGVVMKSMKSEVN